MRQHNIYFVTNPSPRNQDSAVNKMLKLLISELKTTVFVMLKAKNIDIHNRNVVYQGCLDMINGIHQH